MEMKRIFLCCGAGMSSGFLAQALRKAAKKKKVLVEVLATAESEVDSYISKIDILLVAPHMKYVFETLRQKAEENSVKMEIIPEDIYGEIDGEGLLDFVLEKLS